MMSLAPLSELFAEIVGGALGTDATSALVSSVRGWATSDEGRHYNRAGADLQNGPLE
jgi:hypothetical protein